MPFLVCSSRNERFSGRPLAALARWHHQTAARLRGVVVPGPRLVVSVPHRRTHFFPDVAVHQLTDIREVDVTRIGGLPHDDGCEDDC